MVLFILFSGHNISSSKIWEYDFNLNKSNFLKELKKLGKVYCYINNIYKIISLPKYPPGEEKFYKKFREKPDKINIEQFDIDKECQKVYEEIKSQKEDIIVIGHSIGGIYAINFCNMYPKKCKKIILIESVKLLSNYDQCPKEMKGSILTNKKIKELENNIITNNSKAEESALNLSNMLGNKTFKYRSNELKVPTLFFENIKPKKTENLLKLSKYEEEMHKIHGNKLYFINLFDTNHFPWFKYCDQMIKQIKCFI